MRCTDSHLMNYDSFWQHNKELAQGNHVKGENKICVFLRSCIGNNYFIHVFIFLDGRRSLQPLGSSLSKL